MYFEILNMICLLIMIKYLLQTIIISNQNDKILITNYHMNFNNKNTINYNKIIIIIITNLSLLFYIFMIFYYCDNFLLYL